MHSTSHDANTWNLPTAAERRTMQRKLKEMGLIDE
jgi:hypothetical protein